MMRHLRLSREILRSDVGWEFRTSLSVVMDSVVFFLLTVVALGIVCMNLQSH